MSNVSDLIGLTLTDCLKRADDEIFFASKCGRQFLMYHDQNCCESVTVDDICGDLSDLVGSPILMAEEVTSDKNPDGVTKPYQEYASFTWTFYKFATRKGYVTIRWYGESSGYYSESVDFKELTQ